MVDEPVLMGNFNDDGWLKWWLAALRHEEERGERPGTREQAKAVQGGGESEWGLLWRRPHMV
jgi:hypothetical protein